MCIEIQAFTDGSAEIKSGKGYGGFGSYIVWRTGEVKYLSAGFLNTKTGRMEIMAVLHTIRLMDIGIPIKLTINSDSEYVVNTISKGWLFKWEQDKFRDKKNSDLWKLVLIELRRRPLLKLEVFHIKGHQTNLDDPLVFGNSVADGLANYKRHKTFLYDDH